MKYWFKECPRCHGDLRELWNTFGDYIACLQCGYMLKRSEEVEIRLFGTLKRASVVEPARR